MILNASFNSPSLGHRQKPGTRKILGGLSGGLFNLTDCSSDFQVSLIAFFLDSEFQNYDEIVTIQTFTLNLAKSDTFPTSPALLENNLLDGKRNNSQHVLAENQSAEISVQPSRCV